MSVFFEVCHPIIASAHSHSRIYLSSLCNNWNLTDKHLIFNANFLSSSTNKSIFFSLSLRSSAHWKFLHPLQIQNLRFWLFNINNSIWSSGPLHICNEFQFSLVLDHIMINRLLKLLKKNWMSALYSSKAA